MAVMVLLLAVGLVWPGDWTNRRVVPTIVATGLLAWVVAREFPRDRRHRRFQLLFGLVLVAHCVLMGIAIWVAPDWRIIWSFLPVAVEAPLVRALLVKLGFRPSVS
jgi:hypothetical protein